MAEKHEGAAGGRPREPDPAGSITLQGTIERVTYSDERTLYSVLRLVPEDGYDIPSDGGMFRAKRCTAVGKVSSPGVGLRVRLTGSWQQHKDHGHQFAFETFEVLPPAVYNFPVRFPFYFQVRRYANP